MSKSAESADELADALKAAQESLAVINQQLEAAKVAMASATELQTQMAAIHADAQAKLVEMTNAATQSVAARTTITDLQTVIAAKSDHIEGAQLHADKVRADLDRKLTEATLHVTEAEGLKSRTQSAADTATTVLTEIRTIRGSVETDAASVSGHQEAAEAALDVVKGLADKSETIESRIAEYEKRLADLGAESVSRLKTIENLLPGATSAGLAASLDARRTTFVNPHSRWQWVFVGSLIAIVLVAISGLWHVYNLKTLPSYDDLFRLWLARLPVAGALLWLALHASRESALAKRLEEDYGYKSAIASSFEGFRRQMADIDVTLNPDSPLAKLCANTLATLAAPPGRIYDKHELTVSPIKELKDSAQAAADALKPIVDAAKILKTPAA